jgi:hypothetical protein
LRELFENELDENAPMATATAGFYWRRGHAQHAQADDALRVIAEPRRLNPAIDEIAHGDLRLNLSAHQRLRTHSVPAAQLAGGL